MKKRLLGLALVTGLVFALSASAFAATNSLKFITSKLDDAEVGKPYSEDIIVQGTLVGEKITVAIDAAGQAALKDAGIDTYASRVTANSKAAVYNIATKDAKTNVITANEKGIEFKVTATASPSGATASKTFKLKITGGKAPVIADLNTNKDTDLGKVFITTGNGNNNTVSGLAVVGENLPTTKKITITANGTKPVTMKATGLPDGVELKAPAETANKADGSAADVSFTIEGKPEKSGTYKIKVEAENGVGKATANYTLTVLDKPSFTSTTLPDATFGKPYSATIPAVGGTKDHPLKITANGNLPAGLALSRDKIIGTPTGSAGEQTIKLAAESEAGSSFKTPASGQTDFKLTIKADKPSFASNDNTVKAYKDTVTMTHNKAIAGAASVEGSLLNNTANASISEKTYGAITAAGLLVTVNSAEEPTTLTVEGLPKGLSSAKANYSNNQQKITITGTPTEAGKGSITVKAENSAGSATLKIPYIVKVDKITAAPVKGYAAKATITGNNYGLPAGEWSIDDEFLHVVRATPGPVKWKAEKLPGGIKGRVSGDTDYVLEGKLNKEQTTTKYILTATLTSDATKTAAISADLAVYGTPEITTKALGKVTTGKTYKGALALKGTGAYISEAKIGNDSILNKSGNTVPVDVGADGKKTSSNAIGKIQVTSADGKWFVSADFTRLPTTAPVISITASNKASTPKTATKDYTLEITGIAPKFVTKTADFGSALNTSSSSTADILVEGTQPMWFRAYVASKDAKKLGFSSAEEWIVLEKDTGKLKSLADGSSASQEGFKVDSADDNGKMKITLTATPAYPAKGLPITIEATNGAANGKWTKATFKVDVSGNGVDWKYKMGEMSGAEAVPAASKDIVIYTTAGEENTDFITLTMSGDKPWTVTSKPVSGDTKGTNGLMVKGTGETVTLYGTPTAGKETTTTVPFTLTNPLTGSKRAVNVKVIAYCPPVLKSADKNGVANVVDSKDFQVGKAVNIGLALKTGSKADLIWGIQGVSGGGLGDTATSQDLKDTFGITLDEKTGKLSGTLLTTTSADDSAGGSDGKVFSPLIITVSASNRAGTSDLGYVYLGAKGAAFKIDAANSDLTFILPAEGEDGGKTDPENGYIATTIDGNAGITFTKIDGPTGIDFSAGADDEPGTFTVPATATARKGAAFTFTAENLGTVVKGNVKLNIYDADPEITLPDSASALDLAITSSDTAKVSSLQVSAKNATGDTKLKWKIDGSLSDNKIKVAVVDGGDPNGKTATINVTVPAKYTGRFTTGRVNLTVTNPMTKATATEQVTIHFGEATNALPENTEALPDDLNDYAEDEEVGEVVDAEGTEGVTFGAPRTFGDLTAGQRAFIEEQGYIIAAVLPEITVEESGQYDFTVALSEKAPEGAKLVWFAFPKGVEASDDDEIADFFDEDGAEIDTVPGGGVVVVSPWLDADVVYAPVIAVKAESASGAKDTLDDAEAGDTVTEEALAAGK